MRKGRKETTRVDRAVRLFGHGKGSLGAATNVDERLGRILAGFGEAEMKEYVARTTSK